MDGLSNILEWTFISECDVPRDVENILFHGEEAIAAYRTLRDCAIFTNKRLIVKDVQGLTGKKIEIYSLPYNAINMWSTESSGILDINAEVELWTRAGNIKINLKRGVDISQLDRIIAKAVCK